MKTPAAEAHLDWDHSAAQGNLRDYAIAAKMTIPFLAPGG